MLQARRNHVVGAARVALAYGAYTLRDAMVLGPAEINLLNAVAEAEAERRMVRLEDILGVRISMVDLMRDSPAKGSGPVPEEVRIPLGYGLNRADFAEIKKEYRGRVSLKNDGQVRSKDGMTAEEAREFFKSVG